jgi:hypothetical protein
MSASPHLPIVFLACVNSYRRGRRLRYLVHERKAIVRAITAPDLPCYQPIQKGNQPHQLFWEMLPQAQHRLTHLHLVGHADNDQLRLESDDFETAISPADLGAVIDQLPQLVCIYLSGCATPGLLDLLLRKDVPAIMVTQTETRNREASAIAEAFYRQLAGGASVWSAFAAVQAAHPGMQRIEVSYQVEADAMTWLGHDDDVPDLIWGMYYLQDNRAHLLEAPRPRQVIPYGPTLGQQRNSLHRLIRKAATALGLGLLAVGIAMYLHDASSWQQWLTAW